MNTFSNSVSHAMTLTENNAETHGTTCSDLVNLFAIIGSSRGKDISDEFMKAFLVDSEKALRMLFWSRDIRHGAGERQTFRNILLKLEELYPQVLKNILHIIPEYGRWDDLLIFKTNYIKDKVYYIIHNALINKKDSLCAKWQHRKGPIAVELRKNMGLSPKQYRKLLVGLTNVTENLMCKNKWDDINYSKVPSVASARYQKAFGKHSPDKYGEYLLSLEKNDPNVKINASALFPHDVIKSFKKGNVGISEQQWKALPNFAGVKNVLPIVDVSGSMTFCVSGNTTAMDISIGLGLYIAEKQDSAFKNLVMTFSESPELFKLTGGSTYSNLSQIENMPWGMNTNLQAAFEVLLKFSKTNNVIKKDMPEYILIISDMEFDECNSDGTNYDSIKEQFENSDYKLPKIVFWNVNARNVQFPVTIKDKNTVLISGYSPAIMKAILSNDLNNFSPEKVMLETIMDNRYDLVSENLN